MKSPAVPDPLWKIRSTAVGWKSMTPPVGFESARLTVLKPPAWCVSMTVIGNVWVATPGLNDSVPEVAV